MQAKDAAIESSPLPQSKGRKAAGKGAAKAGARPPTSARQQTNRKAQQRYREKQKISTDQLQV